MNTFGMHSAWPARYAFLALPILLTLLTMLSLPMAGCAA